MNKAMLILGCIVMLLAGWAPAAPYTPAHPAQILERLPYRPNDPVAQELRELRLQLASDPGKLPLAIKVARRYLEIGRNTSDPRYAGYAEAALRPWWSSSDPPVEVRVLRATLRQRVHQFDLALYDLNEVLRSHPRHAQARLVRATLLQVQGLYGDARQECALLSSLVHELVAASCSLGVAGVNGELVDAYQQLRTTLERFPNVQADLRAWAWTGLAEMAVRLGKKQEANAHFLTAVSLDPSDNYLLAAYSDFLLDHGRANEVLPLLRDQTRADTLFLRYVLALQAVGSEDLTEQYEQLGARFEASRMRGDRVHLREEARYQLQLARNPQTAFKLAQENWDIQKEPADVYILLAAAGALNDHITVTKVKTWIARVRLQDERLTRLLKNVI